MDGNLLGEGEGGPANIHSNLPLAKDSIRTATKSALAAAGLDEASLNDAHAGLGLAGAGLKTASDRLLSELKCFASVELETDAYVAWLGAHQGGDGGIAILGTGSCGLAIVNDQYMTVAGWGPELSDEAGGQRMGREALRRALWTYDGRAEETGLAVAILDSVQLGTGQNCIFCCESQRSRLRKICTIDLQICLGQRRLGGRPGERGGRRRREHHRQTSGCRCSRGQFDWRPRRAPVALAATEAVRLHNATAKRPCRRGDSDGPPGLLQT